MTKFAVCFLLVFGELALGGMFALAIPPFFKIERGFYKSTACVYLASALMATVGLGMLAWRATGNHTPGPTALWIVCAIWVAFCLLFALYVVTLWTDLAHPARARIQLRIARRIDCGVGVGAAA